MYRYLSGRLRQLGIRQTDLAKAMGLSEALDICRAQPEELHIYVPRGGKSA